MAKQIINIGRTANDRSGDPLRSAFDKVNQNFTELYTAISSAGTDLSAVGQNILPNVDITYDLGSPTKRWRDLYLSGSTIFIGNQSISTNDNGISIPGGITVPSGLKTVTGWKDNVNNINIAIGETYTLPDNITIGSSGTSPSTRPGPFLNGASAYLRYAYGNSTTYAPTVPASWSVTYDENGYIKTIRLNSVGSNIEFASSIEVGWVPAADQPVTPRLMVNPINPAATSETLWDDGTKVLIIHRDLLGEYVGITASGWTGSDTVPAPTGGVIRVLKLPNGTIFHETPIASVPNPLITFEEDCYSTISAEVTVTDAYSPVITDETIAGYISIATLKEIVAASTDFADFKTRIAGL